MHMHDIILYGHGEIMKATEKLPLDKWELPNACGVWSVKNIVAHLAAYELMLVDVLSSLLEPDAITPTLSNMVNMRDSWNDDEVEKRKHLNASETFREYTDNHAKVLQLMERLPSEFATKAGALSWYGDAYDLDDFLVYTFYGHKREHAAQINAFRDVLARGENG